MVTVHNYDPSTFEYTGASEADESLWSLAFI
ncbi:hypothetical protein GGE07_000873 [Sinorhizobium terangae]|nr:hypothetical protein [Sinorhizobium terangae]